MKTILLSVALWITEDKMKTPEWKLGVGRSELEAGRQLARSVLACGDTSPLFLEATRRVVSKDRLIRALQKRSLFCFFILTFACCFSAGAQTYSIDWYKIAGGGGTSSNGNYSVSGTIGQPDAGGAMTGGNYSLTGGFWSLISVVQSAGLPPLTITHAGNSVMVWWPATGSYTLQQNANLASANGWVSSGYSISTLNGTNSITITAPSANLFFRLHAQ